MSTERKQAEIKQANYRKYTFRDHSGYVVAPWISGVTHELVTIRHSASVPPWVDRDVHLHADSEEYYFVFQGKLQLLVNGSTFTLHPHEALLVKPRVPHAVIGGQGPVEHFVLRMPGFDDRQIVDEIQVELPPLAGAARRELKLEWGCRVPLAETRFQNRWLFGVGQAHFHSDYMCLAYLSFPSDESADAGWRNHPHRLHLHQKSWEYYTVLQGSKMLQIEDQCVEINAGATLEVPPGIKHVLRAIRTPYEGFTFRVPRLPDKVEF